MPITEQHLDVPDPDAFVDAVPRLEIQITFEQLPSRRVSFELDGPPERLCSNFFNGVKRMPVKVTS